MGTGKRGIDTHRTVPAHLGMTSGITLSGDMGTFRVDVALENPLRPGERRMVHRALVDTGAELSWFPSDILESIGIIRRKTWHFRQADGTVLARRTGGVGLYVGNVWTLDEVVFAEPGDPVLLGSRSLAGLNLRVDPVRKALVDAGPAPAAAIPRAGFPAGRRPRPAARAGRSPARRPRRAPPSPRRRSRGRSWRRRTPWTA